MKIMEKKSPDLVIVYDKYTEQMANGISGRLVGTYTCLAQNEKVFESNKNSYSNNNRILFLSEDLICQYLGLGEVAECAIEKEWYEGKCTIYVELYSLGNWRGILINGGKTAKTQTKFDMAYRYLQTCFTDFVAYPLMGFKKCSKMEDLYFYSGAVVDFFLKDENLKLIIPE